MLPAVPLPAAPPPWPRAVAPGPPCLSSRIPICPFGRADSEPASDSASTSAFDSAFDSDSDSGSDPGSDSDFESGPAGRHAHVFAASRRIRCGPGPRRPSQCWARPLDQATLTAARALPAASRLRRRTAPTPPHLSLAPELARPIQDDIGRLQPAGRRAAVPAVA